MTWRPRDIGLARAVNGLFFLAVSAYSLLAYTPFAYDVFITPGVMPALIDFIVVSPYVFWATHLITILTLMPPLTERGARGRIVAWAYSLCGLVVGVLVVARTPMENIGNSPKALALGLAALVPPIWLAAIDHVVWPAPKIETARPARTMVACLASAAIVWGGYAAAAALHARQTTGIDVPPRMFAAAVISSLVLHLFVFVALFLAVTTMTRAARVIGGHAHALAEYWLLVALLAVCAALVLYLLVRASLAFRGPVASVCAIVLGVTVAAVWSDVAWLRSQSRSRAGAEPIDSVALFAAPVAGVRSRAVAVGVLVLLPLAAYGLIDAVGQLDWNFLLQKLSVLVVWLVTFSSVSAAIGSRRWSRLSPGWLVTIAFAALALYHGFVWANPGVAIDRYSALDPSLRLIRDARTAQSLATAEHYAFLRSQTFLAPLLIRPPAITFVHPRLEPTERRRPHIFLIVADSLRPDYLAPYNARVTFTPEIRRLAADSFVFERAWSRYSGTALAVPSIWAGGMVPHVVRQPEFRKRNALLALVDTNGYHRLMDVDSVVEALDVRDDRLEELRPGKPTMHIDLCTSVGELERKLPQDPTAPAFFYSLPQNIHVSMTASWQVPAGETYPGFHDKTASSIRRFDRCFGALVETLKRRRIYDDSIVILTADHADFLGEGGRWGHGFWMYPEVMRIPLIVHLPSWLKADVRTDLDAVVFSTDITPSLYALLGYEPRDLGPLFGRPIFTPRDQDSSSRRREAFLLASSYGVVYGALSQNGRRMYVVNTMDGTDYALDLGAAAQPLVLTPQATALNRRIIEQQLSELATIYRYSNHVP